MESGFLSKWPRVSERQRMQFRKRVLLFSVFLLVSVFIWLLNALSKNYTTHIPYPLVYENLPENKVLVGDLPGELDLSVNAHGYALLRYKVFRKPDPVLLSVSSFNLSRQGSDGNRGFLVTRYLKDHVARQLPDDLQLMELQPDTLHFQFARLERKMLPVEQNFSYEVDRSFTVRDGIILSPDSVLVSGPDLILDTLQAVRTMKMDLGLLDRSYEGSAELRLREDLEYSHKAVDCSIELEKFTEVQLNIPVEVINLPDSLDMQTFPARIRFVCTVGLSKYETVNSFPFKARVDYLALREQDKVLSVQIPVLPDYLLNHSYSPSSVEFLISVK